MATNILATDSTADESHNRRILDQYDSTRGVEFYRTVMGDGGLGIHYGLYHHPDQTMARASVNTIERMVQAASELSGPMTGLKVIDLGSGLGVSAHHLAAAHGCRVTCVNLGPAQNAINREEAARLGVAHLVEVVEASFDDVPPEREGAFDRVWSQEALCHARDKAHVLRNAWRLLRPGGVVVFTDLMSDPAASGDQIASFSDRNAVSDLATVDLYMAALAEAGFERAAYIDFTDHLTTNFVKMVEQIDGNRDDLIARGVDRDYLDTFRVSLEQRVAISRAKVFAWGCFVGRKPDLAG